VDLWHAASAHAADRPQRTAKKVVSQPENTMKAKEPISLQGLTSCFEFASRMLSQVSHYERIKGPYGAC
jgi:hypothetical protein